MKAGDRDAISAFTEYIGAKVDDWSKDGYVRLSLATDERHTRFSGGVHEGVVLTMMDSSLGMAIRLKRGAAASESTPHATIDMNASLLRGVEPGDKLIVEGRVSEIGDLIANGEAEAKRESDGELVAVSRLTFIIAGKK